MDWLMGDLANQGLDGEYMADSHNLLNTWDGPTPVLDGDFCHDSQGRLRPQSPLLQ